MRTFYIVTLAHRERSGVAYKVAFGNAVADCFEAVHGEGAVVQWACAEERHQDQGTHYHCLIKLRRSFRWLSVKQLMYQRHAVQVNFSGEEAGDYRGAYAYISKEDGRVAHSDGYEELDGPRTQAATRARMQRRGRGSRGRGGVSTNAHK